MFTNSTKYALRSVLYLSKNRDQEKKYRVEELASELNIPKPYLSKVLQQLAKAKIISSQKGRGGGFYLSQKNANRPLIDIITCLEGHNVFDNCILGLPECGDVNPCILHKYYNVFKQDLKSIIDETSIEKLQHLL
ncbi:MAG: Rrf2 family transcriptional regulator [Saprospiraceae bacterium]